MSVRGHGEGARGGEEGSEGAANAVSVRERSYRTSAPVFHLRDGRGCQYDLYVVFY